MKIIDSILGALRVLFTPAVWIQIGEYSHTWDEKLRGLMSKYPFTQVTPFTAYLGERWIWVGNHPYGSFTPADSPISVRPSRITILRARDKLVSEHAE